MRIILLVSNMTEVGGVQRLVANLANSFSRYNDVEVEIINGGKKVGEEKFKLNDSIKVSYINMEHKDLNNKGVMSKARHMLNIYLSMRNYFKNYSFSSNKNIVVAFGHAPSCMLPFLIKKQKNVRLIGSQHNPITYSKLYSLFREYSLNKLDKYILLSEGMKIDLLKNYNLGNVEIIENPNTLINPIYTNYNNNKVISVGRLTEQKGFDILLEIWSKVVKKQKEWSLEIIGEGPGKKKLLDKIKKHQLQDSVRIKGFTNQIEREYSDSDLFVMTSRYEGFGLVLVEAQGCGLPTIAFDCPFGPKHIINNEEDGYLIKFGDNQEFADKLINVMENKKLLRQLGENAIENSKRFDVETITEKWIKLFNEI